MPKISKTAIGGFIVSAMVLFVVGVMLFGSGKFFSKTDEFVLFFEGSLKGLKVGVMRGYSYGRDFDQSRLFVRDEADSHASNFRKLVSKRIDVYPCDELVGRYVAKESNLMSELQILPTPLKVMDGHIGFAKGKHQETIKKINKVLAEMHRKGEIEKIINQYVQNM